MCAKSLPKWCVRPRFSPKTGGFTLKKMRGERKGPLNQKRMTIKIHIAVKHANVDAKAGVVVARVVEVEVIIVVKLDGQGREHVGVARGAD